MTRSYSPEEKAGILEQHFVGEISVSALCEKYRISPNMFERWKRTLFENGNLIFR